jgi:hypothetical protein
VEFWLVYPAVTLHLLMVVTWAGGVLFWNLVVGPGVAALPPTDGRRLMRSFARRGDGFLTVAGLGAIIFGALSGIAIGRYGEALGLQTRWGWAIAVGATCAVIAFIVGKRSGAIGLAVLDDDHHWMGTPEADRERDLLFARMTRLDRVEMVLFVVILALMALARFS